jgi:hypothetical protein
MEISNKMLAWLVVAAIAVSIFGTIISLNKLNQSTGLTGFATSNTTGTATVDISSQTVLRFVVTGVDFGTGQINTTSGYNNCTMSINDSTTGTITRSAGCIGFNAAAPTGSTFTLQNAGTTYLNVTMNFSNNASTFIGGVSVNPSLKFQMAENSSSATSCIYAGGVSNKAWTEVTIGTVYNICQNLSFNQNNTLMMGVSVVIPSDASGNKAVTILAQGTG